MANREVYPSSLFPLNGDLSAGAGATTVEVIGLQNITIAANPLINGYVPTYVADNGDIEWRPAAGGVALTLNGEPLSADYLILCGTAFVINYGSDDFLGTRLDGTIIGD